MAKQTLTTIKDEHFGIARKIVSNMTTESWGEALMFLYLWAVPQQILK